MADDPHPCFFEGNFANNAQLEAEMRMLGPDMKSLGFFCCMLDVQAVQTLVDALAPKGKARSLLG